MKRPNTQPLENHSSATLVVISIDDTRLHCAHSQSLLRNSNRPTDTYDYRQQPYQRVCEVPTLGEDEITGVEGISRKAAVEVI